jgi:hypothetical protein
MPASHRHVRSLGRTYPVPTADLPHGLHLNPVAPRPANHAGRTVRNHCTTGAFTERRARPPEHRRGRDPGVGRGIVPSCARRFVPRQKGRDRVAREKRRPIPVSPRCSSPGPRGDWGGLSPAAPGSSDTSRVAACRSACRHRRQCPTRPLVQRRSGCPEYWRS